MENLLWLPLEYRPVCAAVHGNLVALGSGSGRVIIDLSQPREGSGCTIISLSGTYDGDDVSIDPTLTLGNPDYYLYTSSSEFAASQGFDFTAGSVTYTIYSAYNGYYFISGTEYGIVVNPAAPAVTCPFSSSISPPLLPQAVVP
jgi:hypothetical protein